MAINLRPALTALLLALLPVGLYFGLYLAAVRPSPYIVCIGGQFHYSPEYRLETVLGMPAAQFFEPAHSVDQRLRRPYWVRSLI